MKTAALSVLVAFSIPGIALADPPPPEFSISFDEDAAIWNPWEDFLACETVHGSGLAVTLCLSVDNVVCDGAGKCACDATFDFSGAIQGSLTGPCTARVNCIGNLNPNDDVCSGIGTKLLISEAVGNVESCDARLRFATSGPVDSTGVYHGQGKAKVCADCGSGEECAAATGLFEYAVNTPTNWMLTVLSHPVAGYPLRLEGTASDDLGFTYTVKGTRSVGEGVSTLVLRGSETTDSEGARIKLRNLVFQREDLQAGTSTIRVQGNKIRDKLGH